MMCQPRARRASPLPGGPPRSADAVGARPFTFCDCRVFWVSDTSLPPSVRLTVGGDDPVLELPCDVWDGEAR
jgi:hypothetical protein